MAIEQLLAWACPSIRSRIHREILGASRSAAEVSALQAQILTDEAVEAVLASQQNDGWISWAFHGYHSMESGIRLLCEKDLDPNHPAFSRALQALQAESERLQRGIGRVGQLLDAAGLGGSLAIRAALLAQAGREEPAQVQDQLAPALAAFEAVLGGEALEDLVAPYQGKLVFRAGVLWPSIYHLRLLAFSHGWRSADNERLLAEAIGRLTRWSPLPEVYVRHRSQLIAPASFGLHDLNPDLTAMTDAAWMIWFHRMELLCRLGVTHRIPPLAAQLRTLRQILAEGEGRFTRALSHRYFREWGAYTGLMLEKDWRRAERREYDLTFRSLLILHSHDCRGDGGAPE